jgi:hexosaminidase
VHNVTIPHDHPQLLGGKFALWNDISGNGISEDDTFDRVFPAVQTLSQKMWTGTVADQSWTAFSDLAAKTFEAPGVNQADRLTGTDGRPSAGDVAVGWTQNGGYTVSFEVNPTRAGSNDVLFSDGFSSVRFFDGAVGFARDGITHTFACKPEPGKWTLLVFIGDAKGVELIADGVRHPKSVGVRTKKWRRSFLREAARTLHFPLTLTPAGRRSVRDFEVQTGKLR